MTRSSMISRERPFSAPRPEPVPAPDPIRGLSGDAPRNAPRSKRPRIGSGAEDGAMYRPASGAGPGIDSRGAAA